MNYYIVDIQDIFYKNVNLIETMYYDLKVLYDRQDYLIYNKLFNDELIKTEKIINKKLKKYNLPDKVLLFSDEYIKNEDDFYYLNEFCSGVSVRVSGIVLMKSCVSGYSTLQFLNCEGIYKEEMSIDDRTIGIKKLIKKIDN